MLKLYWKKQNYKMDLTDYLWASSHHRIENPRKQNVRKVFFFNISIY